MVFWIPEKVPWRDSGFLTGFCGGSWLGSCALPAGGLPLGGFQGPGIRRRAHKSQDAPGRAKEGIGGPGGGRSFFDQEGTS